MSLARRTINAMPNLAEYEAALRDALDAMGAAPRAELLHTLDLADFQRAERIGELWASPKTPSIAELAIDARRTGSHGRCSSGC